MRATLAINELIIFENVILLNRTESIVEDPGADLGLL